MLYVNNIITHSAWSVANKGQAWLLGELVTCEPVHSFLQAFPSQGIGGAEVGHTYGMQSNNVILYTADEYFPYCMV